MSVVFCDHRDCLNNDNGKCKLEAVHYSKNLCTEYASIKQYIQKEEEE